MTAPFRTGRRRSATSAAVLVAGALVLMTAAPACAVTPASVARADGSAAARPPASTGSSAALPRADGSQPGPGTYTVEQSISDNAQLMTLAFDGLGFLSGSLGSDSFFPPGKVADFWGFQYFRDNDSTQMGHNTDFLTRAALTMLNTLTPAQRGRLVALATTQVDAINRYGMNRFELMEANRRLLSGDMPVGASGLSQRAVREWSARQYRLDGRISVARARVMGGILSTLSASQRGTLDALAGTGVASWPDVREPDDLRGLGRDEKVAVMTYAGDMTSWYLGSKAADVYFCPERHGTYFGSFYLKDAPAVGNPGYSIGTNITGDYGKAFLAALTSDQARTITRLVSSQRSALLGIVAVRGQVASELRRALSGQEVRAARVRALMTRYGRLDGAIAYQYATAFASVGRSLSDAQRARLAALRAELIGTLEPTGAFLYSGAIPMPDVPDTDGLFATSPR